jgi:hypothetical protein
MNTPSPCQTFGSRRTHQCGIAAFTAGPANARTAFSPRKLHYRALFLRRGCPATTSASLD